MRKVKTNKLLRRLTLLLLSSLLCCCNDERIKYNEGESDELKMVTFSVKVPGVNTPKTYALTESNENEVSSIAILLFDGSGNYTYQPIYSNTITTDPGDSRVKTFTVQVPEGTYDMVILGNARTSLANVLGNIFRGDSKESVLNRLLLKKSDKWNATSGSAGYIPIPMWGEISNLTISGNMSTNEVSLKRMVSKIDLTLSTTAQSKFNLQSVRLYNYNDQGQIAPNAGNWNQTNNKVNAPSVPGTAQKPTEPVASPHLFDGTAITKDPNDSNRGISCTNEIYTFEALAGSSTDMGNNTCLVVGGFYGEDTKQTYYRVDFSRDTSTPATYLSLLRNHRYTINVTDVKKAGHGTPEDAFNARPVNIVATVAEWNEAQISEIDFEGQYLLGVSQGEFTFTREERKANSKDNALFVSTNYPDGWSVTKIVDDAGLNVNSATNPLGWLRLSLAADNSGTTVETLLLLDENKGSQTRTAFIHLTAGRLSYIVTVRQSIDTNLDITNTNENQINVLEFCSTPQEIAAGIVPVAQSFNLNWSPVSSDLFFTSTTTNSSFVFASGAGLDVILPNGTLTSGSKSYTVQPQAISSEQLETNPFYERSSVYHYAVSDGMATVNKTFTLRHRVYNLVTDVKNKYWLDGSTYTFYVRSSAGWSIDKISQELTQGEGELLNLQASDNLRRGTIGGVNTSVGTPITFRVANQSSGLIGKIKVEFISTDSPTRFDRITVTINLMGEYYPDPHKGWAGSNIYWDGSKLTFDDVDVKTNEKRQGVYFEWGSLTGISPVGLYSKSTLLYLPGATTSTSGTEWVNLPYVRDNVTVTFDPPNGKIDRDRCYLHELAFTNGTGDICKYITENSPNGLLHGKSWRMPTSKEFGVDTDYSNNGAFAGTAAPDNANGNAGKYSISSGFTKTKDIGSPFFPAGGCRNALGGELFNVGKAGYYWSATPDGTLSYDLSFMIYNSKPTVYTTNSGGRPLAYSVRCVVEK